MKILIFNVVLVFLLVFFYSYLGHLLHLNQNQIILVRSRNIKILDPSINVGLLTIPEITPAIQNSPTQIQSPIFNTSEFIYFPISKQNSLGNRSPNDLVELPIKYSTRKILVSKLIVNDIKRLIDAAAKEGITLKVVSGYRSYNEQLELFNYYKKIEKAKNPSLTDDQIESIVNTYSARPGHSEHQLGTAVDVLSLENNYQFDSNPSLKYVQWLESNASKYNFRISYPKNNSEYIYEPWHLRWWP